MNGIRLYAIQLFICIATFFTSSELYGQVLRQPELQFTAPCASASFNEFHVNFSWDPPLVGANNQFILELSDKNGSFSNPTTLVAYSDKNTIFKFEFVFGFPNNVYGENYKVRVRSTSPQMTSPESPAFPAYYLTVSDPLVINNFVGTIYSCDGSPVTIKVDNYPNQPAYRWYRNGTYLSSETHSSITTAQAGIYYVELDYGSTCSSTTLSNAVEVVNGQSSSLSILGDSTREICRQQPYLLQASVDDPLLLYQWYKDGQPVWPLGYYPSIDLGAFDNAEGNWYVITQVSGGCTQQSNTVAVQYRNLNASLQSSSGTFLLPWDQIALQVTTDATQPTYSWYKDNTFISNATQPTLAVTQPGTYYAKVTDTASCTQEVATSSITITSPVDYKVSINTSSDYMSCVSLSTQLSIDGLVAVLADGSEMDIYSSGLDKFTYQWFKDGQPVNNATTTTLSLTDESQNGTYLVTATYNNINIQSNNQSIQLGIASDLVIVGDSALEICDQQSYILQASIDDPTLTYEWYHNDQAVSQQGYYPQFDVNTVGNAEGNWYVEIKRVTGCSLRSNTINVQYKSINASLQSSSGTFVLPWDQIVLQTSTDAIQPTYSWFKDNVLISNATQPSLTVTQPGTYYAKVTDTAGCTQEVATSSITITAPVDYKVSINTSSDYASCVSLTTQLLVDTLVAVLADGSEMDIYSSSKDKFTYQWFKDGQPVSNATALSLSLADENQNGTYHVAATYSNINILSNDESIQLGISSDLAIVGESTLEICNQQSYVLYANIDDPTLIYEWYFNDQAVSQQGYYPQFDVNTVGNAEGNWYVEIKRATGCSLRSNTVSILYKTINASLQSLSGTILFPGDQIILEATSNATQPTYSWYKDDILVNGESQQQLTVTEPGTYYAKITDATECNLEIITATITIEEPVSISMTISKNADYADCVSTSTQLFIDSLIATLSDGTTVDIYDHSVNMFSYQWHRDNQAINAETSSSITLNDANQNGSYFVTAISNDFNITSNTEAIQLGFANNITITSTGSLSCDGSTVVAISSNITDSNYNYQWYKDGQMMASENFQSLETNQSGTYKLAISANGCTMYSNDLEISPINLDSITLDSGDFVTIPEGGSITVTASGADTYSWYNVETTEFLSNTPSLTITDAGSYELIATLNGCDITKSLSVEYIESFAVPNVITPNSDGYNDKWILPNTYAKRDNVEVSIFTLNGDKVIQTYNYQNDWPQNSTPLQHGKKPLYFYKIIKDNTVLKKGTITVID